MATKHRPRRNAIGGRQYPRGPWLLVGVAVIVAMIAIAVLMYLTLGPQTTG